MSHSLRGLAALLLAALLLAAFLGGCGGIPIMSMPKLIGLQGKLLDANPAEFMIAIQADTRLTPPPGSSPMLNLDIKPAREGDFPRVQRVLKMQSSAWSADLKGLAPAPTGRRWLVYGFTPESALELRKVQQDFRQLKGSGKGGSVAIGISQENVAARNPELRNTSWESWLQTSKADGFFELWSGTLGELLQRASP